LLASSLQTSVGATPELRDSFESALKLTMAETNKETPSLEQLTVEPSQESIIPQQHMSHSSHSSHRSHYSGYIN
jgi:hypothetical protein